MKPVTIEVLACLAIATAALVYYVRFYLPRRIENRLRDSLTVFSTAIELRFPSHRGLTDRVLALGRAVGRELGLRPRVLLQLEMATHLRDIGLCAVPYKLINNKPWPRWTPEDFEIYERHGDYSAAMLELVPSLQHLARVVRCHHTAYDPSTGPFAPKTSGIPIEARILHVVTTYSWLERQQGDLLARQALRDGKGVSFDPHVVDAFFSVLTSAGVRQTAESARLL